MENELRNDGQPVDRPEYEPPEIERVMDAEELAREVQYAGVFTVS